MIRDPSLIVFPEHSLMKPHHTLLPVLASALVSLTLPASAEDARAIFEKFESQKAEALAAYLAATPDAADAADAEAMLVDAYLEMDQAEKAAPILQKRYDGMAKGADANLQELIGGVIQPLFAAYTKAGQKDKAKAFIEQAKEDLKSNPQGPQIMQFLDGMTSQLAMPSPGDTMDIAFTAMDGTEVDLSKMTDKVVLVDFWATWCGPCVGELPNVISAYEKYHDKGFEIIGISLDQDKGALEGFVKQRKMTWPQYFDGKGWENDLAKEFGIRGIPATFLIGKDGKIVVTDLRGDMLEQQLGKLLGEG